MAFRSSPPSDTEQDRTHERFGKIAMPDPRLDELVPQDQVLFIAADSA
jgi:hypothetical protein